MKTNFKILVATDYSELATNAERYAIKLAQASKSELTFFHVFESSSRYPQEFIELEKTDDSPVEFELRRLEQHIEEVLRSMNMELGDIECRYIVNQGNFAKGIYAEASAWNCDFIILGTHEPSAMQTALLSSHSWEVIKNAPIPVLALPQEARFESIKQIVFATEFREGEVLGIKYLADIAKQLNAELIILHVSNSVFSAEFERTLFERFNGEVKSEVAYDKLCIRSIHSNNLVDGLNKFCARARSNWLVMSHEKAPVFSGLFNIGSATKKMAFHTHLPLFAVPDKYIPVRKPATETFKTIIDTGNGRYAEQSHIET